MINAYIITEEGRAYTTEGLEYLTNLMEKNYGVTEELNFIMGAVLNDPEYLAKKLTDYPDSALFVSAEKGIFSLYNEDALRECSQKLLECPDATSWQTLMELFKKKE